MSLHGLDLGEATRRMGSIEQAARIDSFVEADGPARGARRLRMITGGGLEIDIHPDRALDLGQVTIDGLPVAWMSAAGIGAPAFYDPHGSGWLRTFGGGFLTTCGLDTFGAPSVDEGVEFGQHGRISAVPAHMTTTSNTDGMLVVEGFMRQSAHLGENLVLRRRIESVIGSSKFTIDDTVTNEGSEDVVHMMMYHANMGWPLVDEGATLSVPSASIEPRDEFSAEGIADWQAFEAPAPGRLDRVFLHSFDEGELVRIELTNPKLGVTLTLDYDRNQLPWLCQWKMMRDDGYVVGIEPVNTQTMIGRADARAHNALRILAPGERVHYRLAFGLSRTR
jgi:hypothetical protein